MARKLCMVVIPFVVEIISFAVGDCQIRGLCQSFEKIGSSFGGTERSQSSTSLSS